MNKKMKILLGLVFGFPVFFLFFLPLVSAIDWTDQLIAYWTFNESSGVNLSDFYDGTNNGTLSNMEDADWVIGQRGNSLTFDGVNEWVNVTDHLDFQCLSTCTVNLWANLSVWGQTRNLVNYWDSNKGWLIQTNGGESTINFVIGNGITKYGQDISGKWTMITGVYNGTDAIMYINGSQVNSTTVTSQAAQDTWKMLIGTSDAAGGEYYNGMLDEMGFWNKTLSDSDISDLWNNGNGLEYEGSEGDDLTVTLISPADSTTSTSTNYTFIGNHTPTENVNLSNATYTLWHSNATIFNQTTVTITGNDTNSTELDISALVIDNYVWNIETCAINSSGHTFCESAASNFSLSVSTFSITDAAFNDSVLETSGQNFRVEIDANPNVDSVSALLWYNGTSFASSIADNGGGNYTASNNIDIELTINQSANKTFLWEFTFVLTSGVTQKENSSIYNQEVNRTYFSECNATWDVQFINITTYDAENPFPHVNASLKSAWEWYVQGGAGTIVRNYSWENVSETNHSFTFCGSENLTFMVDADIEIDNALYAKNFHYFDDASLSNTTSILSLYLLNDSKATLTELNVVDEGQNPMEDVLISIQLYDIGTDTFYTVAMAKTNFNGDDLAYLNWYDSLYKFVLVRNGTTLLSTNPYKISESPQIFEVITQTTYEFDKFEDFEYSLYFNDSTNNFVLTFTKPSGEVDSGCLRVIKRNVTEDYIVCETCETSNSATLYCNIGDEGNGTFIATFYATGSLKFVDTISEVIGVSSRIYEQIGNLDGTVMAIIFAGIVCMVFFISPVMGVIGAILGALGAIALGFQPIDYATFTGIVFIGGVVIWLLRR